MKRTMILFACMVHLTATTVPSSAFVNSGTAFDPASITITAQPLDATICSGATATFYTNATGTSNITYQWQYSPNSSQPFIDIIAGFIGYSGATTNSMSTPSTPGRYRCRINGDLATEVITDDKLVILKPSADFKIIPFNDTRSGVYDICPDGILYLNLFLPNGSPNFPSGYKFNWSNGSVNPNTIITAPGTYTATVTTPDNCSISKQIIIGIAALAKPVITVSGSTILCPGQTVTLSAPIGYFSYSWSNQAITREIMVSVPGQYSVIVSGGDGRFVQVPCQNLPSPPSDIVNVLKCNHPPQISEQLLYAILGGSATLNLISLISDPDDNQDPTTLKILSKPASGAIASIDAQYNLIINYSGLSFLGMDHLLIQVCDIRGACAEKEFSIDVSDKIIVFNAISPNGDGKNDLLIVPNINSSPATQRNKVTIFDRWGDVVFETEDYDNVNRVFTGLNKKGGELPTGTYFYKIEFPIGGPENTGYISLKR